MTHQRGLTCADCTPRCLNQKCYGYMSAQRMKPKLWNKQKANSKVRIDSTQRSSLLPKFEVQRPQLKMEDAPLQLCFKFTGCVCNMATTGLNLAANHVSSAKPKEEDDVGNSLKLCCHKGHGFGGTHFIPFVLRKGNIQTSGNPVGRKQS